MLRIISINRISNYCETILDFCSSYNSQLPSFLGVSCPSKDDKTLFDCTVVKNFTPFITEYHLRRRDLGCKYELQYILKKRIGLLVWPFRQMLRVGKPQKHIEV